MVQEISDSDCTENGLVTNSPKQKVIRPRFYISFALNVFFLGAIFCWVVLRSVDVSDEKECPKGPGSKQPLPTMTQEAEDTYYECSPCKPMMTTGDADSMRLNSGNSSYICCKKIPSTVKIMEPKTGNLLEKCQSKAHHDDRIGALLHLNLTENACMSGLHWALVKNSSYLRGGVEYEDLQHYGRLKVPSDGVYAIYSYIQFDSYTSKNTLDKPKPEMHVLYKNGKDLLHINKFMLRTYSYTNSQVGPLLIELKAGDSIHVSIGSMGRFIYNDPLSSVFGIYKL